MRIVFVGDIYGQSGRTALIESISNIRSRFSPDFIIANSDNAAHGNGISPKISEQLFKCGIDCLTSGDHIWDKREIFPYIIKEPRLVRPLNMPEGTLGKGYHVLETIHNKRLMIIHLCGTVMMKHTCENPFLVIDRFLNIIAPREKPDAIFIDFHAEATSEKMAMAHFLDGRVSAIVGTHTHIQTADARILPKKTAYITDVGMCGDFNSVIGAKVEAPLKRFLEQDVNAHLSPAEGKGTVCGVFINIADVGGYAQNIEAFQI